MKLHTAALAALAVTPCFAQSTDAPTHLETLVVTATRSEQDEVRLPASVRIITATDIAASGARHLLDVLRGAGSLQITDFYGDGSRAQVDARAFGDAANANTLVLVDGRRLNNPDIASPDLNSIALKDIERIEIIEGSAGALYGDQATGGVINVITRAPQQGGLSAELTAGSYEAIGDRATLALAGGGASARLSLERRASDNYREHNRIEYGNALGRGAYDWADGGVFVEAGRVDEDLQTPGALFADEAARDRRQSTPNFRNDFSNTDTTFYRLGGRQTLWDDWALVVDHTRRKSDGVFRLSSVFGASSDDSFQDRDVTSFNPRLTGETPLFGRPAQITLGGDFQEADYELRSPFGTQTHSQRQTDAYAQAVLPLPAGLDLTAGARRAHVRNTVQNGFTFTQPTSFDDDQTAAQFGLSWRPLAALRVFTRVDRNFRYAKVDEFTFTGAGFGSNQNLLRNQRGRTLETGAEWSPGGFGLAATRFRLDTEQEIAFDPAGGPFGFGANVNLPATRRDGALLRAHWQALAWLGLAVSGQYVDAQVTEGPLAGHDIPLAADRIASASANLSLPHGMNAQAGVSYTGRRALAGDFDNSLRPLPPYAVTHLALGWDRGPLLLSLRVDNLLDRRYSEYGVSSFDASFNEQPAYQPSPERHLSLLARLEI